MSLTISKEINAGINKFKEACDSKSTEVTCTCTNAKTASLLYYIFNFANQYAWCKPLPVHEIALKGQSVQLRSVLENAIKPEMLDDLEKASLNYLRYLSTGWKAPSSDEAEKFKASASDVVLQKAKYNLTVDSRVLEDIFKIQPDCGVTMTGFSARTIISGEKEKLERLIAIVRSSLSYEPKSLVHLTLEVLAQNFKRDDNELTRLPLGLKDKACSYLFPGLKSTMALEGTLSGISAQSGGIISDRGIEDLWARTRQVSHPRTLTGYNL